MTTQEEKVLRKVKKEARAWQRYFDDIFFYIKTQLRTAKRIC